MSKKEKKPQGSDIFNGILNDAQQSAEEAEKISKRLFFKAQEIRKIVREYLGHGLKEFDLSQVISSDARSLIYSLELGRGDGKDGEIELILRDEGHLITFPWKLPESICLILEHTYEICDQMPDNPARSRYEGGDAVIAQIIEYCIYMDDTNVLDAADQYCYEHGLMERNLTPDMPEETQEQRAQQADEAPETLKGLDDYTEQDLVETAGIRNDFVDVATLLEDAHESAKVKDALQQEILNNMGKTIGLVIDFEGEEFWDRQCARSDFGIKESIILDIQMDLNDPDNKKMRIEIFDGWCSIETNYKLPEPMANYLETFGVVDEEKDNPLKSLYIAGDLEAFQILAFCYAAQNSDRIAEVKQICEENGIMLGGLVNFQALPPKDARPSNQNKKPKDKGPKGPFFRR